MSNVHPFVLHGWRGCLITLLNLLFAVCAVILSAAYQYPAHPLCRGGLGAGFPLLFICDAGLGGSPISSWGRIDLIDIANGGARPGGFLVDFLFYTALFWIVWIVMSAILPHRLERRDLGRAAWLTLAYTAGLLCASLLFFSSELYEKNYARTPTPLTTVVPSGTPTGTPPSLDTPIPAPVP